MKVVLWVLGILVAVILLITVALPLVIDEKALVELAADRVEEQSGVVVTVAGDASLSIFPELALSATEISIEVPDSQTSVTAETLSAGVELMPLLRNSIEVDNITVAGLVVTTEASDEEAAAAAVDDTSTLSDRELDMYYAARTRVREKARADAATAAMGAPLTLEVGELSLRDIRVRSVSKSGELLSEFELAELYVEDLNTDGRLVPLTASMRIPGSDEGDDIGVEITGAFTASVEEEQLSVAELRATVTGATQEPLLLTLSGDVPMNTGIADLQLSLESGTLQGSGSLRYGALESPQIDAQLQLTELNPALLLLAGPEAAGDVDAASNSSEPGADVPLPLHGLRMIDTRAVLAIDAVVLDAHRLENVAATLRAVDGVITLEPVTATLHGGDIAFNAVLDAHYNSATLSTAGNVVQLDIGEALAAAAPEVSARGTATLEWELGARGNSVKALTSSLSGPIDFTTDDITLVGIGLERLMCSGVALANQESLSAEFPADTQFADLSAKVQLQDGVANLEPLNAQLTGIGLVGTGNLDLTSQNLRASFRARLSPELGELDPACEINERYTDISWPLECQGKLDGDPAEWCNVDTTEIIRELAENEARRKLEKEGSRLLKKLIN